MPKKKHAERSRLNVIDLAAALLLLAALAATVYYFTQRNGLFTKQKYTVEYELTTDAIYAELAGNLSEGDALYHQETVFPIGRVRAVSVQKTSDGYSELRIRVRVEAEQHDGFLSVNGMLLAVGNRVDFRTPELFCGGTITSVSVVEDASAIANGTDNVGEAGEVGEVGKVDKVDRKGEADV